MNYWIEVFPSGQIRSASQAPEGTTPPVMVAGNAMVEVETLIDPRRKAWFDGALVDIGEAPSPAHVYDYQTRAWSDPRTLAARKEAHWETIKAQRDAIEFGPFVYDGHTFDGDRDAQRRLNVCSGLAKQAIAAGGDLEITYVLMDNSTVVLHAADFVAIELTKVQQVLGAFAIAMALRAQIEAATTLAEVEAVTWPT